MGLVTWISTEEGVFGLTTGVHIKKEFGSSHLEFGRKERESGWVQKGSVSKVSPTRRQGHQEAGIQQKLTFER